MDDDKKLPTLEEEFAELDAELKRIASLPVQTPEQRNALIVTLESLRSTWLDKAKGELPPWRKVVDAAIATAFDGIIVDLSRSDQTGATLDAKLVQSHLRPVLDALAVGLKQNLVEKFGKRPPPGVPPPKVDATDVAAMLLTLFGPPSKKK